MPAKPSRRPRDALQRGGLPATDDATERLELLETEVVHLRAELDLKESFVTHLTNSPEMRRALARVHSHQRRRERLRTLIQRLPLVGPAARRLARIARRMRLR